jgi:hypothetical protein
MNKLSVEEKVRVVACLVEGNSLRSTVRLTGGGGFKSSLDFGGNCQFNERTNNDKKVKSGGNPFE